MKNYNCNSTIEKNGKIIAVILQSRKLENHKCNSTIEKMENYSQDSTIEKNGK